MINKKRTAIPFLRSYKKQAERRAAYNANKLNKQFITTLTYQMGNINLLKSSRYVEYPITHDPLHEIYVNTYLHIYNCCNVDVKVPGIPIDYKLFRTRELIGSGRYRAEDISVTAATQADLLKPALVPNILYKREWSKKETFLFEIKIVLDVVKECFSRVLDFMDAGKTSDNEIIIKNANDKIKITESDIRTLIEDFSKYILKYEKDIETMFTIRTQDNSYSSYARSYNPWIAIRRDIYNIRKKLSYLKATFRRSRPIYWMTKDTAYIPADTKVSDQINRRYIISAYNPQSIIALVCVALNNKYKTSTFEVTDEQIASITRASVVYDFLSTTCYNILYSLQHTVNAIRQGTLHRIGLGYSYTLGSTMEMLSILGVSSAEAKSILDRAIADNKHLVDTAKSSEDKDASESLARFLTKISLTIDISGTRTHPDVEKKILKRLRDLGRFLATKHGVDYDSDPANVVLEALRRSEETDDIIADIIAAVEDCLEIASSGQT